MFYELNTNSPYFPYMQDTSVEDKLSIEEKDILYRTQLAGILFSMFEGASFTEDEKNFMIYASINDFDPRTSFNIIRKIKGFNEINFTEVDHKKNKILHII